MSRVTCNGCFDGLHKGHMFFLGYAAAHSELVVGINSDDYIRRRKRAKPNFNENERRKAILDLAIIKDVIVFDEDDPREFIRKIGPDVHCTGAEYGEKCIESEVCRELGIRLVLIPRIGKWATSKGD